MRGDEKICLSQDYNCFFSAKFSHWVKCKDLHAVVTKAFFKQSPLGLIIFSTIFIVLQANHSCPMAQFISHDMLLDIHYMHV